MSLAVSAVYLPESLKLILVKRSGCAPAALTPLAGSGPLGDLGVAVTSVIESAVAVAVATSDSSSAAVSASRKRAGTDRIEHSSVTGN
jgi:hypothetical protein